MDRWGPRRMGMQAGQRLSCGFRKWALSSHFIEEYGRDLVGEGSGCRLGAGWVTDCESRRG